jgi:ribonuclease Z
VLVHESTFDASREENARQWGHSTSVMAGRFARAVGAGTLLLTHFSARYTVGGALTADDLVREAQAECPETRVIGARDLWNFEILRPQPHPRVGGSPLPTEHPTEKGSL